MHSWRNNSIIVSEDRTLKVVAYGVVKHIQAKLFKPEFTKLPAKQNENIQTDKLDNWQLFNATTLEVKFSLTSNFMILPFIQKRGI